MGALAAYMYIRKNAYGSSAASCVSGGATSTFTAVLQLFCPAALLPGLLRCLCRLLLPFWAFTAFVALLLGLLRCLCRLLLPFWAFTAFVDFYWISRLLLTLSTCTAFVDFYCLYRLLLPVSAFTAFVWCCCRCLLCWLWLLNVVTCWSDQLFCFETWLADSNKLCPCIGTGLL